MKESNITQLKGLMVGFLRAWMVVVCIVSVITVLFFFLAPPKEKIREFPVFTLFENPGEIFISSEINIGLAIEVISQIRYFEENPSYNGIIVYINSCGGNAVATFLICEAIEDCKKPVATVVAGNALSGAGIILVCGDKELRFATPSSRIFLHGAIYCLEREQLPAVTIITEQDLRAYLVTLTRTNHIQYQLLADHTPWSVKEVEEFLKIDRWITPQEAIKFGMIDSILR